MSTELITTNSLTIAEKLQFKDERLSAATQEIISVYNDAVAYADAKNRQLASILSRVKNEKSYVQDGFSSVADYASKTFGFNKGKAYQLAAAGDIYNDETASERLKAFTPSKLAEVATVSRDTLETDVASGKITTDTTQKALREYKSQNSTNGEEKEETKVLDTYMARPINAAMNLPEYLSLLLKSDAKIIPDWDNAIMEHINSSGRFPCEMVRLPKAPALLNGKLTKKKSCERRLYVTHDFALVVEFLPCRNSIMIDSKKPKMTREELKAEIEKFEAELAQFDSEDVSQDDEEDGNEN